MDFALFLCALAKLYRHVSAKSFFCVLRKTLKTCDCMLCIYYCVTSKITIDERLNGFMVYMQCVIMI